MCAHCFGKMDGQSLVKGLREARIRSNLCARALLLTCSGRIPSGWEAGETWATTISRCDFETAHHVALPSVEASSQAQANRSQHKTSQEGFEKMARG
jgi:hypothetical protein